MSGNGAKLAVEVKGLTKRFKRFRRVENYSTLKSTAMGWLRGLLGGAAVATEVERWTVLDAIDLEVPRGMSLGIIGANGSGKSTLLRLLAGIYLPDGGEVKVHGRCAAMLELGAGFHPEFTGRENAVIYGVLMGFDKAEVEARMGEIEAFSGLEDRMDAPVRTYSSGQVLRLAFSVVTHLDPDVFLIDEALAVGDGAFIAKCHARLRDLRAADKTLIVVTHDERELLRTCDKVCVLTREGLTEPLEPKEAVGRLEKVLDAPMTPEAVFLAGLPGVHGGPPPPADDDEAEADA